MATLSALQPARKETMTQDSQSVTAGENIMVKTRSCDLAAHTYRLSQAVMENADDSTKHKTCLWHDSRMGAFGRTAQEQPDASFVLPGGGWNPGLCSRV